jgi:hypothetical protein
MLYKSGHNNYLDFTLDGQKILVVPKHDIINSTVIIESDGNLIYTETKNLERGICYWFVSTKNIYHSKSVKISILDKSSILLDYFFFENLRFDFEINTLDNKFKVLHFGKIKVNIQLINLDTGNIFCNFFADFSLGETFWHTPDFKILDFSKFKFSILDEHSNLLIEKVWNINLSDYIFCHIPKNAGSSIFQFLANNAGHSIVDKKKTNSFVCAFVREPYDRFLSCYYYLKSGGKSFHSDLSDRDKYIGDSDISDFIKNKLEFASQNQTHFRPQSYWIPNGADFTGRFETLQEDFDRLMGILNLPKENLPLTNFSKRENYTFTPEEKEIIYQVYKEDFERFGYSK